MMILLMLALPLCGAVVSTLCARRSEDLRDGVYLAEIALVFCAAVAGFALALGGRGEVASLPGVCGLGLTFRLDGFRALYALIAAFMWLMTGLLSREYFAH